MLALKNIAAPCRAATRSARTSRALSVACRAEKLNLQQVMTAAGTAVVGSLLAAQVSYAEFRLPPISKDPGRCDRGYVGNTIGQANAVSDKILDLRKCDYKNQNLSGKVLAGALLEGTDMTNANMQEAVLTKAYAVASIFENADLTNAVLDRVDFTNANLKGVKLVNAVVTGATFEGADLTNSVWEDALVGNEDVKRLCKNPTLTGESRVQVGCRN